MNETVFLFDADGVTIAPHKRFSDKLIADYHAPADGVGEFFRNDYRACALGQKEIESVLAPRLKEWAIDLSVGDVLADWYQSQSMVNREVIDLIQKLRLKGHDCYLVSDNEAGRADYILNKMGFVDYFDGYYFSYELGKNKENPHFFIYVLEVIGAHNPANVRYYDDDQKNVDIAKMLMIDARLFTDVTSFQESVTEFL